MSCAAWWPGGRQSAGGLRALQRTLEEVAEPASPRYAQWLGREAVEALVGQLRDTLDKANMRVIDLFREWDDDGSGMAASHDGCRGMGETSRKSRRTPLLTSLERRTPVAARRARPSPPPRACRTPSVRCDALP